MNLMTLQNKLIQFYHKVSKEDYLANRENLNKKQFEALIKSEIYRQGADVLISLFPLKSHKNDDEEFIIESEKFYIFSERDMYNLVLEISDIDERGREILVSASKKGLGIKGV